MNPYLAFVSSLSRMMRDGKSLPLGGIAPLVQSPPSSNAPVVLIFSPHPDDECVIGGLALRLMRERGSRVVNIAVTQGSKPARQQPRLQELRQACQWIGFELKQTAPNCLERINPKARASDPQHWQEAVRIIAALLARYSPRIILFPHEHDWNSTHIGTHFLVMDALRSLPATFSCFLVETEFWGQMASPNLMIELSEQDLADMLAALSFHVGEVRRNPYHLSLPAWMLDNVRRGAELVGVQGGAAPEFMFATLYRLRRWRKGCVEEVFNGGRWLGIGENPGRLFDSPNLTDNDKAMPTQHDA